MPVSLKQNWICYYFINPAPACYFRNKNDEKTYLFYNSDENISSTWEVVKDGKEAYSGEALFTDTQNNISF